MYIRITLLGGTSDIGEGLALHWIYHTDHEVIVGLRDPGKAYAKANEYETELSNRGRDVKANGFTNEMAVDHASVVVLAMPPYHISGVVEAVSDSLSEDNVLVTPAMDMKHDNGGFHYRPLKAGSVTALVADTVPDDVPVIDALYNLAAGRLAGLDADLGIDTLLVADDEDAKETVCLLAEGIDDLHALDGGGLANAPEIEGVIPLLTNIARNNGGLHDLGIRFKWRRPTRAQGYSS